MSLFAAIVFSRPSWLAPCLGLLALLALALIWASRRGGAERWVSLVGGGLKLAGASVLALCLLEPLWVTQRARPGANVFALIADNSQSLRLKDDVRRPSRGDSLREALTTDPQGWQVALDHDFLLRRYIFDSRLQSVRDFSELTFDGYASSLGGALREADERWRGQPVAGALLFTDGNATDLPADLPPLVGCPPIYPVVIGSDSGLPDVSLDKAAVSQTAFEDAPVTIQAAVTAQGFGTSEIRVQLTEVASGLSTVGTNNTVLPPAVLSSKSNLVASLSQRADAAGGEVSFRFQIQPDKPGLHFYQLEARAAEDLKAPDGVSREATLVNNRRLLVVDRGQEVFRVLCVAGRPDWEYKFLNRALQEDPQVHMVTLMRLARREPKFEFKGRNGEGSNPLFRGFGATNEETARYDQPVMIRLNTQDGSELRGGFPKTAEELFKYHAVILDRVEAEFLTHEQMLLLRRFVSERGGGFLMLGSTETFHEGGYAQTAIASMLPVYLDRPAEVRLPALFKLNLTREGWLQPWIRLRATENDERLRLAAMPPFQILNPIRECKPGASLLTTVSDADNHTFPALAVQRFGLGSVAALMVGDLWRWGINDETMQKDLAKSWRQLIRWLVSDVPGRVSVEAQPGEDPTRFRLVVKVRDEEFKPLDNASVRLSIRPVLTGAVAARGGQPPGPSLRVGDAPIQLDLPAEPSGAEPGKYQAVYVARQAGAYCVDALVTRGDGQTVGRAETGWTTDPAVDEFRSLKPNRALLETLARRTGGKVIAQADLPAFVRRLPELRAPVTETVADPLWRRPAVYLFALACFLGDWGLRRRKGLP